MSNEPPTVKLGPSPLPVGVLLPTRNARSALASHLAAMDPWLPLVEEVVVVDSESTDGTAEYLREHLRHPRIQFLSHPPGLYESWNWGIARIRARYTYIATVGDAVPEGTLRGLVEEAEAHAVDAVLTPPDFVDVEGHGLTKRWPIQAFLKSRMQGQRHRIGPWEWFAWAVMYLPGSLLGSSASNLYRTDYLRAHPFPLGYGHACDTAWALANAFRARITVAPELRSVFWVHPAARAQRRGVDLAAVGKLVELAREVLAGERKGTDPGTDLGRLKELLAVCLDVLELKVASKRRYFELRRMWYPWFLQPSALRLRWGRHRAKARIRRLRGEIVSELSRCRLDPEC